MSHADVHFWNHNPPLKGETQEQWLGRRLSQDRRKGVTSVFPPGVTQNQVLERAAIAKLKAEQSGQNSVIKGKVLLDYVGKSTKTEKAYFEVKIVVCRTHCEPNLPGDVISIFPINGPMIYKSQGPGR